MTRVHSLIVVVLLYFAADSVTPFMPGAFSVENNHLFLDGAIRAASRAIDNAQLLLVPVVVVMVRPTDRETSPRARMVRTQRQASLVPGPRLHLRHDRPASIAPASLSDDH